VKILSLQLDFISFFLAFLLARSVFCQENILRGKIFILCIYLAMKENSWEKRNIYFSIYDPLTVTFYSNVFPIRLCLKKFFHKS
jgi:hypothetical protein